MKKILKVKNANGNIVSLLITKMVYAENIGHCCLVIDINGKIYTCSHNVSYIIKQYLGFNLFQIHKSHIINLNYISEFMMDVFSYKKVIMRGGKVLAVSGRVAATVRKIYKLKKIKCGSWRELIMWNT